MHLSRSSSLLFAAAILAVAGACAEDPNVPVPGVPGSYHATTFTLSSGGPAINLLALGASLTMTLGADHTTTGRLVVPATVTGGEKIDDSLAGTWRQSNDTVYFDHPADTFIRDIPFVVRGGSLAGEFASPDGKVAVTLSKYGAD